MLTYRRLVKALSMVTILTMLFSGLPSASAQGPDGIERQLNARTGKVSFIGPEDGQILSAPDALGMAARPQDPALALAKRFGPEFGLKDPQRDLKQLKADQAADGRLTVRYQQNYQGIPVMGGELIVNTNGNGDLYSLNGEISPDLALPTQPAVDPAQARQEALQAVAKWYQKSSEAFLVSEPELWIYDESLLQPSSRPAELVWRMDVTPKDAGMPVRELVLVNAQRGGISLHFNQVDSAWNAPEHTKLDRSARALPATDLSEAAATNNSSGNHMPALLGASWYVATTGSDSNSCSSSGTPCLTINAAIDKAANGDTILIAEGLYINTMGITVVKNLLLRGGWNTAFLSQTGTSSFDFRGANGLYIENNATIERLVFRNGYTGIMTSGSAVVTLAESSVYGMLARGIQNGGTLYLENSTISGNADTGIYNISGNLHILNSTITNNSSSGNPATGGIFTTSPIVIQNSILANNTKDGNPSDCYGDVTSSGNNIIGTTSGCNITPQSSDFVGVNPQVSVFLSGGYHALFSASSAIDAGNASACTASDQRGVSRPVGVKCDIGAYEYTVPGSAGKVMVQTGSYQVIGLNTQLSIPLKALVLDAVGSPVAGKTVTFIAPGSGPSGVFAGSGTNQTTAVSDINGIASAPIFTTNLIPGSYWITASVSGVTETAKFTITNIALYVKPGGNDNLDCLTPATACSTINGAISKAQANTKIFVAEGTYADIDEYGYEVVAIDKSISLSGGWNTSFSTQNQQSIIDGQNSRNGITVYWYGNGNVNVSIDNFIIKNSGDGIKIYGGTVTLRNSSLINNQNGANNQGTLTVTNITASQNSAYGIANHNTLIIQYSTISNNLSGIYSGSYVLATTNIQNSILARNGTASSQNNCNVAAGSITSTGYNLISSTSGCPIATHVTDLIGVDALMSPLLDSGLHALFSNSPAINAGNSTNCPAIDQRKVARPVGIGCDIGSFEYRGGGLTPAYIFTLQGTPQTIEPGGTASSLLKGIVLDSNGDSVSGTTVTFTAPASGASGTFANTHTNVSTAVTDANGVATASAFTANNIRGGYVVQAIVAGLGTPANFQLFNGIQNVKTYTANNGTVLPGSLLCNQDKPNCTNNVNPHADAAHKYAMGTNTFYATQHGRDSIDNLGMGIISTVHYDSNYGNAFWNGSQMVYGDAYGFPLADDVVAHELTHGVTEHESNLFYYYQSGAINESFSDLWGEFYDQTNGLGNDAAGVKWLMGEDVSGLGALRSMSDPTWYGDPDKMTSFYYYTGEEDSGGVHTNSGINNKAAYLMVGGGSFNGKTVTVLGWTKTAAIYYEANTKLLSSGADYSDLYYALQQACTNLIGQKGITAANCADVKDAIDAVEMNGQPVSGFNTDAPLCAAGSVAGMVFTDNLEAGTANWTFTNGAYKRWQLDSPFGPYAQSGNHSLYANDYPGTVTDATAKLKAVVVPNNAYLYFAHAYGFETGYNIGDPTFYNFDGGVLEYSINGGSTWTDAGSLINFNGYKGVLFTGAGNPLSGRSAFVGSSHGYISSRVNLASLAGKNVTFRWRMGLDEFASDWGWWVDNVKLYTCNPMPGAFNKTMPGNGSTGVGLSTTLAWNASPYAASYQYCYDMIDDNQCNRTWGAVTGTSVGISNLGANTTYYWQVRAFNAVGTIDADNTSWGAFTTTSTLPAGTAGIESFIAARQQGSYSLLHGQSLRESYAGVNNGPLKIAGANSIPLIAAERVIYKVNGVDTSFIEMMALPASQLDTIYWLPWYNNKDLNTQLRFANVSATEATVHVSIGGVEMTGSPYILPPGASTRKSYAGIDKGPVKIESNVTIVAAERVIYKVNSADTSFSEMMAMPASQLDTIYWLPWYNNKDLNTQLRIANVSATEATVHVTIGGVEMTGSPYTLAPGASRRLSFAGIDKGPVKIESDVDIVAAERVIYNVSGVDTSFIEMMALPDSQLDTIYWLPWYNNKDLDTQLRIANVSATEATVHVTIGGVEMTDSPYTLAPGASRRLSFPSIDKGPVKVESNVSIVAAERVIYKVNSIATSFSEMMALPNSLLDTIYWLPWYNNVDLNTQLRFGVP